MKLKDMIEKARKSNDLGETEMWSSIEVLDNVLEELETDYPELAEKAMLKTMDIVNKGHFMDCVAMAAIEKMHSVDSAGNKVQGLHWSVSNIVQLCRSLNLPIEDDVTEGDLLFAFNSFWHDMHRNGDSEEKIFSDAYRFYFDDEDYSGPSKPFSYYKGMIGL